MTLPASKALFLALVSVTIGSAGASYPGEALRGDPSSPRSSTGKVHVKPGRALDDCSHVADGLGGPGYHFIATCAGKSLSPDGKHAVVQSSGEAGSVSLATAAGELLDDIPALSDEMPFVLFWSPNGRWFFANQFVGSGLDRLRVFEIVDRVAIERSSVFAEAIRGMIARYPCLAGHGTISASGWQWSGDGQRIAMIVYARPDACEVSDPANDRRRDGDWQPLWMIGDVESGSIKPDSVRVRPGGVGPMPKDGAYARL